MFEFLRNVIAKPLTESDIRTALAQSETLQYLDNISLLPKRKVIVTLAVDPKRGIALEEMRLKAEHVLLAVPNVKQALVILTAEKIPNEIPPASPITPRKNAPLKLEGIKKIIAVSSGKGGVGKSTVAANIAVAMAERGLKIGLMDGDIYGPSVPRLFGLKDTKPEQKEGGIIIPITAHGIKIMSMGFLVDEGAPKGRQ
jgi:ATP-binding protein involved in chromosome partitioning